MNNPKISIVVPVYNVEPYIRECFDSIAAQTYGGEIECIFVDDCGQDHSVEILEGLMADYHGDIDFSLVHHEHNKGLSGARNTGIRRATGDYLYFLDSDDTITPDCIERLATLAMKYPGVEVVQGSAKSSIDVLSLEKSNVPEFTHSYMWIRKAFLQRYTIPVTAWNKLVSRQFVLDNNIYFEEGLIHEDELWNFFLSKYVRSIAFCKVNTYLYRENPNGIVKSIIDRRKSFVPIVKAMYDNIGGKYVCSEILCIADILLNYFDKDGLEIFLKSLNCSYALLSKLFFYKERMNETCKFSFQGLLCRLNFHLYYNLINLTYKGK